MVRPNLMKIRSKGGIGVKRISLALGLALVLVLVVGAVAFADPYTPPKTSYTPTAPAGQTQPGVLHGDYQKNTDACASCHIPHKAPGADLLKWNGVQATCKACHDGTMNVATYNVYGGTYTASNGTVYKNGGGLFAPVVSTDLVSFSAHPVDAGTLKTSSAPGGDAAGTPDTNGAWNIAFNCVACHSPHGQGNNGRSLNPDVNGIALQNAVTAEQGNTVSDHVYFAKTDWIMGYPYSQHTAFIVDTNDNLSSGFTWDATNSKLVQVDAADTRLVADTDYTFDTNNAGYRKGYIVLTAAGQTKVGVHKVFGAYVPGLRVLLNVSNYLSWTDPTTKETVTYESGINKFCGACHTDYNTSTFSGNPGDTANGTYTSAYRHKVGMTWSKTNNGLKYENDGSGTYDKVTCVTCHYSHGVDKGFFVDNTGAYDATATESAGSSYFKRMPNMGTCENCHQKGPASTY